MNEARARQIVVLSLVASGAAVTIGAASRNELPRPRQLLAGGVVFVALAALADSNPTIAGPAAALVGTSIVLAQGSDAAAGVLRGVTSTARLGTKDLPDTSAPAAAAGSPAAPAGPVAGPPAPGAPSSTGGARAIVESAVGIAQRAGGAGVGNVSDYRPGDTVGSGAPSDHSANDANRAARDIAVSGINALTGPPSPKLDAAAAALGRYFGRDYGNGRQTIIDTFTWHGYRVQIIWRTPLYGGHMGHIHIGVRKQ